MTKKGKCSLFIALGMTVLLLMIPVSFVVSEISLPSQFDKTYYGELGPMVDRLKKSSKRKIVFVGNSAVSFGVDSTIVEKEFDNEGMDVDCIHFGLYGSIGTKAMMELSLPYIDKDDIVVLMPEEYPQAMSTYFSGTELWYCIDSDRSILHDLIGSENNQALLAGYLDYVPKKLEYSKKEMDIQGIYQKASFDEEGNLKNYPRENNIMDGYVDPDTQIKLTDSLLSKDYLDMVNTYAENIKKKGAFIFYSFAPMNRLSVNQSDEEIYDFFNSLSKDLTFPVMSDPKNMIMEENWFYDSNFHLNESGMIKNTMNLVSDIKNQYQLTKPLVTEEPSMPELPKNEIVDKNYDNSFEAYFNYQPNEDGSFLISSLTEEGRKLKEITLPAIHEGKPVKGFAMDVFTNDTNITRLTIQDNITRIRDSSFQGSSLKELILTQSNPSKIQVGFDLLKGAEDCNILIPKGSFASYSTDYFWGHYVKNLKESI